MLEDARVHPRHQRVVDLDVRGVAAPEGEHLVDRVLVAGELAREHDQSGLLFLLGKALLREYVAPCDLGRIVSGHETVGPPKPSCHRSR